MVTLSMQQEEAADTELCEIEEGDPAVHPHLRVQYYKLVRSAACNLVRVKYYQSEILSDRHLYFQSEILFVRLKYCQIEILSD